MAPNSAPRAFQEALDRGRLSWLPVVAKFEGATVNSVCQAEMAGASLILYCGDQTGFGLRSTTMSAWRVLPTRKARGVLNAGAYSR